MGWEKEARFLGDDCRWIQAADGRARVGVFFVIVSILWYNQRLSILEQKSHLSMSP